MNSEIKDIEARYPSICYHCENARKPASDTNTAKGYVGCCMRVISDKINDIELGYDYDQIISAKEIAEGWVDLKSRVKLGKGSGIITNLQILTREVRNCKLFKQIV